MSDQHPDQFKWHQKDLKTLWYFFKSQKRSMLTVIFVMLVASILESLNLAALYPIINYGLNLQAQSSALKFLDSFISLVAPENLFLASCFMLIVLTALATVTKILCHYLSNQLTMRIIIESQKSIFEKYLNADYKYFVKNQQGKLIYAGTVAPLGISTNVFYAIRLVNSTVTVVFLIGLMALLSWPAMIFMMGLGLVYVIFVRKVLKKMVNQYSHLSVREDEKKNIVLNEFITGIKSIKAFDNYLFWKNKYNNAVEKSAFFRFKVLMGNVFPDSFLKFMFFTAVALVGIFLGIYYKGNVLSLLPLLGTFAVVAGRLIPYVNLVGNDIVAIARYMPETRIVYDILNEKAREFKDGSKVVEGFHKEIAFKDVWFRYDTAEQSLFEGINFTIEKNKVTAIVGPSGSGKSTITNLLLKLYKADQGRIEIDGADIYELTNESYLHLIGYVGQETFIFNGTIRDNICFGLKASDNDIYEAAKLANAHEFILSTENGYETIVGDAGVKLSGGQRQRLAIARAMLRKPLILVLDEATSSLDNVSERLVQEAINQISRQTTLFVIAHRLSTVQSADKIIVLEKGRIVEEGDHKELISKQNVYFQLYTT